MTTITAEQAQEILNAHSTERHTVSAIKYLSNNTFSNSSTTALYQITTTTTTEPAYILSLSPPHPPPTPLPPNSLQSQSHLLTLIASHTALPVPHHTLDTSLAIVPFHYLLHTLPSPPPHTTTLSLSHARAANLLSPHDTARIHLQLGIYLAQIHALQHDAFGPPNPPKGSDPCYSWQEHFTLSIEALLTHLEASPEPAHVALNIPYADIRALLSRAIAFFLFDDVDVPTLTWLTASEDDIFLFVPCPPSSDSTTETPTLHPPTPHIAYILPHLPHALYADPLLESLFTYRPLFHISPSPTTHTHPTRALLEGYTSANGPAPPPITFARQRTKRAWYDVFVAALVLVGYMPAPGVSQAIGISGGNGDTGQEEGKGCEWAVEVLRVCVDVLRDMPCY